MEGTVRYPNHTTSSYSLGVYGCHWTGSLVFTDDMTADKSSGMISDMYRAILSARIQPNASILIGKCFTLVLDVQYIA